MAEQKIKAKKINKPSNKKRSSKKSTKLESREDSNSNSRIRVCMKSAPLKPLNTGAVKVEKKKSVHKKVIPKRPRLISKKPSVSRKTLTKARPSNGNGKNKKYKSQSKPSLPTIVESPDEFRSEVVFNPRTGCLACEEGRKGEGDSSCWACRLHRLQTITDRFHNATRSAKFAVK